VAVSYISWAAHCSRSDVTARELNGVSHMIYWRSLGSHPATVALKYLGQSLRTWRVLLRDKPDAVFVMTPPVVAGLAAYPYCAIRRIPFVLDAHTAAFLASRWRYFQWLQWWLCRKATTTIVTNAYLATMLADHGADATVLPDVPVRYAAAQLPFSRSGFTVGVVGSFDIDEPAGVIWETARALPDIQFWVTGDPADLNPSLVASVPANLRLTGFLSDGGYGRLLDEVDVVMAVTSGRHKMLRAAYEAIYAGKPVVLSDSPLLREEFASGAILADNSGPAFAAAITRMRAHLRDYTEQAQQLARVKQRRWETNKRLLAAKIGLRLDVVPDGDF
jgi:glycosyltransferase involved in cell wall biosynthesis